MSTLQRSPTPFVRGFDVWSPIDSTVAAAAVADGYVFCARYVDNLTQSEVSTILGAGLALVLLRKAPALGGYSPPSGGTTDGQNAAVLAQALGIPSGACLFSDLEDVSDNASSDVQSYSNNWAHAVSAAGYTPGLYVDTNMFSDTQLYENFAYQHYWMGGSSGVPFVHSRGYQLYQSGQTTIAGLTVDLDYATTDLRGGRLIWVTMG